MKKIIKSIKKVVKVALLTAALAVAAPSLETQVQAQNFKSESFLTVRALNVGTNAWNITNLAAWPNFPGMFHNPTNITYTNSSGTFVGSGTSELAGFGTTNQYTRPSLFRDVPLYPDRQGRPVVFESYENIAAGFGATGVITNRTILGGQTLYVELVMPRGSNQLIGLSFRPIWNGRTVGINTNDIWTVQIAALSHGAAPYKYSYQTNVPTWKWPGAYGLRLSSITNLHLGAGPDVQTNSPFITELSINGFVP